MPPITSAADDTHTPTPPFGVVSRTTVLVCIEKEKSSSATNLDPICTVKTNMLVWGSPVVNTSILPSLYSDTPLPQLV
ncbi:hypothetical protein TNCV_1930091 [Trichonephila clavipes]|nr:hypothetical protein TNCV_1930091 [Trichonephila clavipes]